MTNKQLNQIWQLHNQWIKGVLIDEVIELETATLFLSHIPGAYNNYAVPKTSVTDMLQLEKIEEIFKQRSEKSSIYLFSDEDQRSWADYLIAQSYTLFSNEAWMVFGQALAENKETNPRIKLVAESNIQDFNQVSVDAYGDFSGMLAYLEVCRKAIKGELKSSFTDLKCELYIIYDNQEPAAVGGLFFSKQGNLGYLHSAATSEKFRGRGYQTALLEHRVKRALDLGLENIYSLIEESSQSYKNALKVGFEPQQIAKIFVKNIK